MKITFVGGQSIPSQGGIENYIQNLAAQLHSKGHATTIICRGSEKKEYEVDGIKVTRIRCKENFLSILKHNIYASWHLLWHGEKADVVNYQSIFLPFLYEWMPKLRGMKVIHTVHSFAQDNPKYGKISRNVISFLYRVSGLVFSPLLTVSEYNRGLIRRRLKKDAAVINCGVDMPYATLNSDVLTRYGLDKGKYYLTIGRVDPVKNLDILIKAFLMRPADSGIKLVICGNMNNSYGESLRALCGDDDRVVFTGPVAGDDKASLLAACLAYCLVSSSEGFPIALLEAMSYGRTCICSSIPACEEVLPKDMGLWCDVRDEISLRERMAEFERNPERYGRLGSCARKRVEDSLTWDKISDKFASYLSELLER